MIIVKTYEPKVRDFTVINDLWYLKSSLDVSKTHFLLSYFSEH